MVDYNSALLDRLGSIDNLGQGQTTWDRIQFQRQQAQQLQAQTLGQMDAQIQSAQIAGQNYANISGPQNYSPAGGQQGQPQGFQAFMNSIGQHESGGNYGARNADTGAMGKYQIMPSNLGGTHSGWDWEALHQDVTPQQFMQSPQIQEKIAQYKLQQYYQQYGPAGASVAWYAGPGAAAKYAQTGQASTYNEGAYPSVAQYVKNILGG